MDVVTTAATLNHPATGQSASSCLHCILSRALRAETPAFEARGIAVKIVPAEPIWLPAPGGSTYRALRRLLASTRIPAQSGPIKLTLLNMLGRPHVEVLAVVTVGRSFRTLACTFPRHVPGTLDAGFAEGDL
jgi:hypothetical protein